MAAGRKDQESDGWETRLALLLCGIYSSDFWGKKKPGQMCTKMPFFNSYTVGCIPNSSCLINALASDCCCSRGWNVFHLTEPSDSGPTTPLPNKKLLLFVLDRLQK
jgi:hypothetical protein